MVFSSVPFLTLFLPVVLSVYYFCFHCLPKTHTDIHRKAANTTLLVFSLLFYFWGEGWRVGILCFSCVVNYGFAWLMMWRVTRTAIGDGGTIWVLERVETLKPGGARTGSQKFFLIMAVVINLGFLAYYNLKPAIVFYLFDIIEYNQKQVWQ